MTAKSYVIITAARNEEKYIEKTIRSVITQRVLPAKWVIVSDASTDRTDSIVQKYARIYPWIELVRITERRERQFAAKVSCFNTGYKRVLNVNYDVIVNLDADIAFNEDYFEFLLDKFSTIPDLGVAGTPFIENREPVYNYSYTNIEHVSGACQLFRRECFESLGGFVPVEGGGEDWIAVTTARMLGWKTKTFVDKHFYHQRPMASNNGLNWRFWLILGKRDYSLGWHPLWELFRALYQATKKPLLIRGILLLAGYLYSFGKREKRVISEELMEFNRREQMQRLRRVLKKQAGQQRELNDKEYGEEASVLLVKND